MTFGMRHDHRPDQAAAERSVPARPRAAARAAAAGADVRGVPRWAGWPGRTGGEPLPPALGPWLSAKVGDDVSKVRVHTGARSAQAAAELGANAFTYGQDIHFATGRYRPDTSEGVVRLLHEVAHASQQRGTQEVGGAGVEPLEAEVDAMLSSGRARSLSRVAPTVMLEPTYPRRTTGHRLLLEVERVLQLARDPASSDPTQQMWSNVPSNFGAVSAGSIARRIWTFLFLRHFTEPESRPGIESAHPRYFFSHTYGWVDGQHFFGFIDFAEQQWYRATQRNEPDPRAAGFEAATRQGFQIESRQQLIRDYVMLQHEHDPGPLGLLQIRPPNTPLFRLPVGVAAGAARQAADLAVSGILTGTQRELYDLLDRRQRDKFFDDSARSAWTYEDPTSNQLGIRFFFQHGAAINAAAPSAREGLFRNALLTFFTSIGVENDPAAVDRLARGLPTREQYLAGHTTEATERSRHPDLYRLP